MAVTYLTLLDHLQRRAVQIQLLV